MFGTYTKVGLVEESSPGVTPASALQLINVSGIKMPQNRKRGKPDVLTGDRRRYPSRILQESGQGITLPQPWQYENDLLLQEGLLNSTRGSAVSITATTISFDAATNKIEDSANGMGSLATGDLVHVTGAGAGANAGKWLGPIIKTDAGELVVPAGQLTTVAAGGSVKLYTRRLLDAETLKSYSLEEQFTKLTTFFRSATLLRVGSGKFSWKQGEFAIAEYLLTGKIPTTAAATIGTGAPTAAMTTEFMNAVDDLQQLFIGGYGSTLNDILMTSWELTVENVLELIFGLGNRGPSAVDVGATDSMLDVSMMMSDAVKDLKAASDADASLFAFWASKDPSGNSIAISLPALKCDIDDIPVDKADGVVAVNAKLYAHDPAKDTNAPVSSAIPYQTGFFYAPAGS